MSDPLEADRLLPPTPGQLRRLIATHRLLSPDVSFKDIQVRVLEKEVVGTNFRMQRLDDFDYSFGAAVADFKLPA